jgi:hypothetical protein
MAIYARALTRLMHSAYTAKYGKDGAKVYVEEGQVATFDHLTEGERLMLADNGFIKLLDGVPSAHEIAPADVETIAALMQAEAAKAPKAPRENKE